MSYAHSKAAWLIEVECSAEKFLAVALGWLADKSGTLSVSNPVLSHLTGLSERTVSVHIRSLADAGHISIRQRGRGKKIILHYVLTDEEPNPDNAGCITCTYCGAQSVPMELDHIHPRSRGGTDERVNLTVACVGCNTDKGPLTLDEWFSL